MSGTPVAPWSGRRAQQALSAVKARGARHGLPCCICKQAIDYTIPSSQPLGCSVQHVKSRHTHPHLTWDPANWEPAHLMCNQSAGTAQSSGPAATSRQW